jgi:16S rRNA (guanine527-N7)-methyltransferase
MHPLENQLRQGLQALALDLSDTQVAQLLAYQDLIQKWTRVYNLTAVRDPQEMLTHHLLDSLAVVAPLQSQMATIQIAAAAAAAAAAGTPSSDAIHASAPVAKPTLPHPSATALRLLDVGSGAGLPGVVLAICLPDLRVDCVDTVAKKAAFVQQAAVALKLPNLRGVHARVENLDTTYDVVSARAFASLLDFTTLSAAALQAQGIWLGMKAKHPEQEIAALPPVVQVFHVEPLQVPGLDAARCIVWMRKTAPATQGLAD